MQRVIDKYGDVILLRHKYCVLKHHKEYHTQLFGVMLKGDHQTAGRLHHIRGEVDTLIVAYDRCYGTIACHPHYPPLQIDQACGPPADPTPFYRHIKGRPLR